jgi:hypothetical protein
MRRRARALYIWTAGRGTDADVHSQVSVGVMYPVLTGNLFQQVQIQLGHVQDNLRPSCAYEMGTVQIKEDIQPSCILTDVPVVFARPASSHGLGCPINGR